MRALQLTALVVSLLIPFTLAQCGPSNPNYNPHEPKASTTLPFFEGWYARCEVVRKRDSSNRCDLRPLCVFCHTWSQVQGGAHPF